MRPEVGRRRGKPVNAQYNIAAPDSLPARIARQQRRKMFSAFMAFAAPEPQDTILDLGVTSDRGYDHSNYFCAWYPRKTRITALGLDDASFLGELYPGLAFVRADGRDLPFADKSFDMFIRALSSSMSAVASSRRASCAKPGASHARPSSSRRRTAGFPSSFTPCCRCCIGSRRVIIAACSRGSARGSSLAKRTSICCRETPWRGSQPPRGSAAQQSTRSRYSDGRRTCC